MPSITERLDLLKETIQRKDFLKGEGLSNEVNIRMFCYESKEEMAVRAFTERLSNYHFCFSLTFLDNSHLHIDYIMAHHELLHFERIDRNLNSFYHSSKYRINLPRIWLR